MTNSNYIKCKINCPKCSSKNHIEIIEVIHGQTVKYTCKNHQLNIVDQVKKDGKTNHIEGLCRACNHIWRIKPTTDIKKLASFINDTHDIKILKGKCEYLSSKKPVPCKHKAKFSFNYSINFSLVKKQLCRTHARQYINNLKSLNIKFRRVEIEKSKKMHKSLI